MFQCILNGLKKGLFLIKLLALYCQKYTFIYSIHCQMCQWDHDVYKWQFCYLLLFLLKINVECILGTTTSQYRTYQYIQLCFNKQAQSFVQCIFLNSQVSHLTQNNIQFKNKQNIINTRICIYIYYNYVTKTLRGVIETLLQS